jgi:hypothetical protein
MKEKRCTFFKFIFLKTSWKSPNFSQCVTYRFQFSSSSYDKKRRPKISKIIFILISNWIKDVYQSCIYSPTDSQGSCLKQNNIKFYNKTAPTCFGAVTPSSGSALLVLTKVTVVKITNYSTSMYGDLATSMRLPPLGFEPTISAG